MIISRRLKKVYKEKHDISKVYSYSLHLPHVDKKKYNECYAYEHFFFVNLME